MNPPTTKPTSDTPLRVLRVCRGGCWYHDRPLEARAASRSSDVPAGRGTCLGFRTRLSVRSPRV